MADKVTVEQALEQLSTLSIDAAELGLDTHMDDEALAVLREAMTWRDPEADKPAIGRKVLVCCEFSKGRRYVTGGIYWAYKAGVHDDTDAQWTDESEVEIRDRIIGWKPFPEPIQ